MFQRFRRKIKRKLTIFLIGLATIGLITNYQIISFFTKKNYSFDSSIKKIKLLIGHKLWYVWTFCWSTLQIIGKVLNLGIPKQMSFPLMAK